MRRPAYRRGGGRYRGRRFGHRAPRDDPQLLDLVDIPIQCLDEQFQQSPAGRQLRAVQQAGDGGVTDHLGADPALDVAGTRAARVDVQFAQPQAQFVQRIRGGGLTCGGHRGTACAGCQEM